MQTNQTETHTSPLHYMNDHDALIYEQTYELFRWFKRQHKACYHADKSEREKAFTILSYAIAQTMNVVFGYYVRGTKVSFAGYEYLDPDTLVDTVKITWKSEWFLEQCRIAVQNWPDHNKLFCGAKENTLPELFQRYYKLVN